MVTTLERYTTSPDVIPIKDQLGTTPLVKIANYYKDAARKRQALGPYLGLKSVAINDLPQEIPVDAKQRAIVATRSHSKNVKNVGKNALTFLSLRDIFAEVDSVSLKGKDVDKSRDEVLVSAMISVAENASSINQDSDISDHVRSLARLGASSYLHEKDGSREASADFKVFKGNVCEEVERKIDVRNALRTLTGPRVKLEIEIIDFKYGLRDGVARSNREVGEKLEPKLCGEAVRKIGEKTLGKLRHSWRRKKFQGYH